MSAPRHRTLAIVACVLLLHALALWALQTGLLQRVAAAVQEIVVPVSVLTERPAVIPPAPKPPPPVVPSKPVAATPLPPPPQPSPVPAQTPAALPQAAAEAPATAHAPSGQTQPSAAAAPAPAAVAPPPPKVDLPSSSADYLNNPKPVYPKLSERRGEQGTVLLSVLVGADGHAKEVRVKNSSGYERLDQAAREAVLGWTFVPGRRNGVAVEMPVDVPIRFKPSE